MEKNFLTLLKLCEDELHQREYNVYHHQLIKRGWYELTEWMNSHNYTDFNREIGYMYCEEAFGSHLRQKNMSKQTKVRLRSVRMLISYQEDGYFEYRTPSMERIFSGAIGELALEYLKLCEQRQLSSETIYAKRMHLYEFNRYLEIKQYSLDELNTDIIESFFKYKEYSLPSRHNASKNIKIFLRHAFDVGATTNDQSIYVLKDNYKKQSKLPSTYEESEIKEIIAAVERSSAIGKRDYLILLLAAEYGWRSSDITNFRFEYIDWDENIIQFNQKKKDNPVRYPLLASIGNAIIDYTKNGRPLSNASEIIVSAEPSKKGLPLSPTTIHSIVTKYMRKAGIRNWQSKKHGAHSLRHSLARNMLKKNISMPIIKTVMGHQSTESTKKYLSVDTEKLRQCALPMPPIHSEHYQSGVKS